MPVHIHRLNQRLASLYGTRQIELLAHADGLGAVTDQAIRKWWDGLWRGGANLPGYFDRLPAMARESLADGIRRLAYWGHATTAKALADTLPLPWLQAMVLRGQTPRRRLALESRTLTEDIALPQHPGALELTLQNHRLSYQDLLQSLRNRIFGESDYRRYFEALLFPPPAEQAVRTWIDNLMAGADFAGTNGNAAPARLHQTFANLYAQGKNHQEIAKEIFPLVGGVQSSARRVARTYGMATAHAVQAEAHAAVDDLTIGFQIHATLDQNTRPFHRMRNGTVYYKEPKGGQPGLDQAPHPPAEADGSIAWN